jgi:hypothetical protein
VHRQVAAPPPDLPGLPVQRLHFTATAGISSISIA